MNILLLAQGAIADLCLPYLKEAKEHDIHVKAMVTSRAFYKRSTQILASDMVFIDNSERNEQIIRQTIEGQSIDVIISIQHPWIISEGLIESVNGKAFNLHNAKLPDYKGHNSISHAILNKEKKYTTTLHWLSAEVDMGDIIFENDFQIKKEDTAFTLYNRSLPKAVENFARLLDCLIYTKEIPRKKIKSRGVFYPKNKIHDLKEIKDPLSLEEIVTKYRAFYFPPHEPAYMVIDGIRIYPQLDLTKFYNT